MEDFDVKKEVKAIGEAVNPIEEPVETPTQIETPKEVPIKETKQKPKVGMKYLLIGIIVGIVLALMFVQLEVSPYWITRGSLQENVLISNIAEIQYYTSLLCETGNVTVFEINNPEAEPIMNYNGQNISTQRMDVNEVCAIYQANKAEQQE